MKYLSRLTALLLALVLLFSSSVGSIAEANLSDLTRSSYDQMVAAAKEAAQAEAAAAALEAAKQPIINEGGVVYAQDIPEQTKRFDIYEVISDKQLAMGGETAVTLPQSGKVNLSAGVAAQWQIYVPGADIWVNIAGETGETFALTYAVIGGMLSGGAAKVRALAGDSAAVANVTVAYGSALPPVEEEDTFVAEAAAASTFSLRRSASTSDANAGIMLAADVPELVSYTIIINYAFADGTPAASSWYGTFAEDSEVNETVNSPTVIGYTPDQSSVTLNYPSIDQDYIITVTYAAAEVDFTVIHHQQNLNDDKYTEVERSTESGYTQTPVGEGLEKSYEGFYSLLYDTTAKIAADGTTEVLIYYDRYYRLMSFNLDGGYGEDVEPIYARYGAPVSAGTPTKAGYTFAGWKDDSTGTVYTVDNFPYKTMPKDNTSFTAQWTANTTTFDVVFWYENANDNGYSQAGVLENQSAVAGSVVNGSSYANSSFTGRDADHFTYSHADSNVVVKGDGSTVVNVYFSRNIYTLTFSMGSWANSCSVEEHRHGDSCYTLICTQEVHTHDGCTRELTCTQVPHTHSSSCCTVEEHTHTNSCYTIFWLSCGKTEHSHGDGNCSCATVSHSHSDSCYTYSCGKVAHTHSAVGGSCYAMTCGKYEHYHSGSTCYVVITAKYDADITDVWAKNPVKGVIDGGYVFQSSKTSKYYSFLEKMPGYDLTMTKKELGSVDKTIYYYVEVLEGVDYSGVQTKQATKNGVTKTYYLYNEVPLKVSSGYYLTYTEDYFPITGFTQRDSSSNWTSSFDSNNEAFLYYVRNNYDLTFSNHGTTVANKGGTYPYEADISGTYFVPDYPSTLEADAYVFDGWYTSPFFGDTKFDFTTTDADGNTVKATMPANDLTLYARWVPKEHNVSFYLTEEEAAKQDGQQIYQAQVVPHRETADKVDNPERGEYIFVGWFYKDGDTEKAFDFSMPITQDLKLYAKWSSNKLMMYTIRYAVKNADGTYTYIADEESGSALAGTNKTFEAKSRKELYEEYQTGYYPVTNSHSFTIDIENPENNIYVFEYVSKQSVGYTVKYMEKLADDSVIPMKNEDGTDYPDKTDTTKADVVTEKFVPFTGYMPDAYQKRLVLSADESENVIIFYYVKDEEHAPVQIIHYIQNAEGEEYTIYRESTDLNGFIGKQYDTSVLSITGYDFVKATANGVEVDGTSGTVVGTVTAGGLKLELYYNRELHPYEFRFVEQGTNNELADPVTGTARYGSQVIENAKDILGYTCKDSSLAITIQREDDMTAVKNVRTFYYVEGLAEYIYIPVGLDGVDFGSVSLDKETIGVKTGTAKGSTPIAKDNYKFDGWFLDEDCTTPVTEGVDKTTGKLTPVQGSDGLYPVGTFTYYAKFVLDKAPLTITKTGMSTGENAIFNVSGPGFNGQVDVPNNGSITLFVTCGDYTVTEAGDWTARYEVESTTGFNQDGKVTVAAGGATVTFANKQNKFKWLDDESSKNNQFK